MLLYLSDQGHDSKDEEPDVMLLGSGSQPLTFVRETVCRLMDFWVMLGFRIEGIPGFRGVP